MAGEGCAFRGAAGQVKAAYSSEVDGAAVELFHATYTGKPRRDHSLITYGNKLYDPAHAQILSSGSQPLRFADGRHLIAGELRLTGAAGLRVVWYWYCVDRRCTRSRVFTKMLQGWDVLRGHLPQSAVWALSVPVGYGGIEQARADLRAFVQALPTPDMAEEAVRREPEASGSTR